MRSIIIVIFAMLLLMACNNHNQSPSHSHDTVDQSQEPDETGLITFTSEQARYSKISLQLVEPGNFSMVITTSGEFLAMPGAKQNVVARSPGIILFTTKNLVQGKVVEKGEVLFTLTGKGLADNNILVRYNEAKVNFYKSRESYIRHKSLLAENIISKKQFTETKGQYTNDSIIYYSLKETVGSDGMKVIASQNGRIHELNVSEGQYVEAGELLATISNDKVLLLRADVPQQYYGELKHITSTHFRPAYSRRVYTLEELSGKLIAKGSTVAENDHYLPVYFEVENDGTLLEGAFAEFYLKTEPEPGHIVIPVSSLVEEHGSFYVYVQVESEKYQKRPVIIKASNGISVSIASGLSSGERVVTEGAMLLKTNSSAAIPSHSHSH